MKKGDLQSRTINALRFPLILYVVLIHSYTSTRAFIDSADFPGYRFVSFLLSLEIAQVAVPAFFFISGYLFFFWTKPYVGTLRDKVQTLLIPYLFWNTLILALYALAEFLPATRALFSGNNLPIRDYAVMDYLRAYWDGGNWDSGNGTPILHQFWYIRNLMLLIVISPLVKLYVEWLKLPGIVLLLAIWTLLIVRQDFIAESITFFVTGAWFSLNKKDFLPLFNRYFKVICILYPCSVVLNMIMRETYFILPLTRVSYLLGVAFTFSVMSKLVAAGKVQLLSRLAEATFFVFAFHDPMLTLFKRAMIRFMSPVTDFSLIVLYFVSVILVVGICLGVYVLLRRWMPSILNIITGHRHEYRAIARTGHVDE